MKNAKDIIVAHLHEEASTDEVRMLFEWVRENPENAKEFARYALLHSQLRGQLSGELRAHESLETAAENEPPMSLLIESATRRFSLREFARGHGVSRSYLLAGSLAASLLFILAMILPLGQSEKPIADQPSRQEPFATIAQTVDVVWGQRTFFNNDRIAADTLELSQGIVRLELDSGVRVTLQGPAQFELITLDHTKLASGVLTATVPPGSEGFRVDTPHVEVTDLGTAFGIHIADGISNVSVFDGEVDVALPASTERRLLKEGETATIGTADVIETNDFDGAPYERLWPVSSGIESSTGAFRLTPPWPRRIRFVRSDNEIFVAPEGYTTTLTGPLKVNISEPGEYVLEAELSPSDILAGRMVRSFILHFHPEHGGKKRKFARTTGSIKFDRPVLGLMVLHEELAASADRFPGRRAGELLEHRQLELTGNRTGDVIALSEDRRTVSLDLGAPTRFSDLVRVIVDAASDQQTESTGAEVHRP